MNKEAYLCRGKGVSQKISALYKDSCERKSERELCQKVTEIKKAYMDYAMSLDLSKDSLTDIERELNSSLFFLREDLAWYNKDNLPFHRNKLSKIMFDAVSVR